MTKSAPCNDCGKGVCFWCFPHSTKEIVEKAKKYEHKRKNPYIRIRNKETDVYEDKCIFCLEKNISHFMKKRGLTEEEIDYHIPSYERSSWWIWRNRWMYECSNCNLVDGPWSENYGD